MVMSDDPTTIKGKVLLLAAHADGSVDAFVAAEDGCGMARLSPVKDGQPLMGGSYFLVTPNEDSPLADAEITHLGGSRRGPANYHSDAYRQNYERIFGKKGEVAEA